MLEGEDPEGFHWHSSVMDHTVSFVQGQDTERQNLLSGRSTDPPINVVEV